MADLDLAAAVEAAERALADIEHRGNLTGTTSANRAQAAVTAALPELQRQWAEKIDAVNLSDLPRYSPFPVWVQIRDVCAALVRGGNPAGGEATGTDLCGSEGPGGIRCAAPATHALAHWSGGTRTVTWDNRCRSYDHYYSNLHGGPCPACANTTLIRDQGTYGGNRTVTHADGSSCTMPMSGGRIDVSIDGTWKYEREGQ